MSLRFMSLHKMKPKSAIEMIVFSRLKSSKALTRTETFSINSVKPPQALRAVLDQGHLGDDFCPRHCSEKSYSSRVSAL